MPNVEELKKIQTDHYHRCKKQSSENEGLRHDAEVLDKISYATLKEFLPKEKCRVLDLGCGEAIAFDYLSDHDYYGIDCCDEALEIAKTKVKSPENLILGMIEELPFEDSFFDVVWARHILEHSSDIEKTLDEIVRVLKPTGLLIYALPQGRHDEPAHLFQTDRVGWFKLLSGKFGMLHDGEHAFNLNEYYGVCQNLKGGFSGE